MVAQQSNPQIENILKQAEQLATRHDWSGAANIYQQAVGIAPENVNVLGQFGWYLSRAKRFDEAIKIYEKLSSLEPKMAKWPYMAGYQYYDQQRWKEAISWFDQALSRYENYLIVLYRKGYALSQIGENETAISTFEKCINIWRKLNDQDKDKEKKPYSDTCFQLGKSYLSIGHSKKAELILAEAVKFDSQDAYKLYEYGKALLRNQKAEDALIQLQKAEKIEQGKDFIIASIAQALIELSRIDEADKALARIPEKHRKEYVWRAVGRVRLAQGKIKESITAFHNGIRLDPKNHNAYYQLGLAYIADNDYSHAFSALSKAVDIRKSLYNLDFPEAKQKLDEVQEYAKNNDIDLTSSPTKSVETPMGVITKYNNTKGFGFIKRSNGDPDLFFHVSCVQNPDKIEVGQGVNFVIEDSSKGPRANNITFVDNT